ncbi:beta-1 adrenergic receptor-like [Antedon mediterranea]|uniref:beta-1 adrenergic receptor-like n=1 Tax=Antedon mediterranea TaxID=105859 RepID=UPI003AF8E18A
MESYPNSSFGYNKTVLIFVLAVYIPMDIIIIVGNTFVLVVIRRTPSLHELQFTLLASLAFVDLLSGLIGLPLSIWGNITRQSMRLVVDDCELQYIPGKIFFATSYTHLLIITTDRYIAITKPLHYHKILTRTRIRIYIALSWIFGCVFGVLYLFPEIKRRDLNTFFCFQTSKTIGTIAIIVAVSLGIIMMIFMYTCIFIEARKHHRKLRTSVEKSQFKRTFKGAKTALIVVGFFMMYYLPNVIRIILSIKIPRSELFWLEWIAEICTGSSMAINPLIYVCRYKRFAQAFHKLCHSSVQTGSLSEEK